MGPYAWQYKRAKRLKSSHPEVSGPNPSSLPLQGSEPTGDDPEEQPVSEPMTFQDDYKWHSDLVGLPRSQEVFRKIELDPNLSMKLPKPNATAGAVLQHSIRVFESLLEKNKPMTFKVGITHDPSVRWHNRTFGYKYSKDKFGHLVVVYAAANPVGPSFLEAALIDRFRSFLLASTESKLLIIFVWMSSTLLTLGEYSYMITAHRSTALRFAGMQESALWWGDIERGGLGAVHDVHCLHVMEEATHDSEK